MTHYIRDCFTSQCSPPRFRRGTLRDILGSTAAPHYIRVAVPAPPPPLPYRLKKVILFICAFYDILFYDILLFPSESSCPVFRFKAPKITPGWFDTFRTVYCSTEKQKHKITTRENYV